MDNLKPGMVIIRRGKDRIIIAGRVRGRNITVLFPHLLNEPRLMSAKTDWILAGNQKLSQAEQRALRATRLSGIYTRLKARIQAKHGPFVDAWETHSIHHDGTEYIMGLFMSVGCNPVYQESMDRIKKLLVNPPSRADRIER